MNFNLLKKYMCLYITVGITAFLFVTFISYKIDYSHIYNTYSDSLYRQAVSVSNEYAADYFSNEHLRIIETELKSVSALSNTRIIFIDTDGHIILDTQYTQPADENGYLYTIYNFDYSSLGTGHTLTGTFYGMFKESYISVFAPITNAFTTKGYAVVSIPESYISDDVYTTFNTNYITMGVTLLLSISFILLYIIHIHKPLGDIAYAIKEYGKGNLAYKIQPRHNDEIGRLALSLNYMANKLNEGEQFQQKFLSNISHDFRSPLTSIKGYLEAMSDGTIPPEMMGKYFDILLFETDRLTKLTSNILTLNELDPSTVSLDITTFDINSIIKHTIETFEGLCKKKKIQFQLTFSGEEQFVKADKGKITQVIYNLVDNAIKFSPENSCIYISVRDKGEKAYISVKDTGIGIPKKDIDKIWDRFYKSDSSRGRDKKGSGLGLSITREIIISHHEHIDVVSTPGVGTEFTFSVPAARKSLLSYN